MRLIDADKVPRLSDMIGCAYEGGEYQAYKSGAEYGRGLVDDTPTIDPETLRPTAHISPHFQNDDFTVLSALDLGCVAMFQYGAHSFNYIVRQRPFTSARIPAKQEQICFICQDPPVM